MTDTGPTIPPAPAEKPFSLPLWFPDTRSILAVATIGCVFGAAFSHVDQGIFTAILPLGTMVLGWYFGSSKGSDDKSAAINSQLNKGA